MGSQLSPLALRAYLARVGIADHEVRRPTVAALRRLHRSHIDAIPFTSVHTALGRLPALDLPTLQSRLVEEVRGGYCMEHVGLFAAVLDVLGFAPEVRLATVGPSDDVLRPPTHLTVLARPADDPRRWLADVGFGVGILGPLPVPDTEGAGEPQRHGSWEHRVDRAADGRLLLLEHRPDGWLQLHAAPDRDVTPAETDAANRAAAHGPRSPFAGKLVAMRASETTRERLLSLRLERTEGMAAPVTELLEPEESVAVLEELFGVRIDDDERAALVGLLAERRHDQSPAGSS